MTFNTVQISCLEDLYCYSEFIKRGVIGMPNISKLSRQLGKDRKTIRKALKGEMASKTRTRTSYLDKHYDKLLKILKDKNREFYYYQHLYNFMKREHKIGCSYSAFKRYIQTNDELNSRFKKSKSNTNFTQRFETPPGEQVQFDLKERVDFIDKTSKKSKVNVPTLTLGFSRDNIRSITIDTSQESVIDFMARAFDELGGVPESMVIDNIKCLVDKPRTKNKEAVLNARFAEFAKDYNIRIIVCKAYRPQTKGKTETQNKVPGQLKNYNGTYTDLHEAHKILDIITNEDNNKVSQATGFPPAFLLQKEKEALQPLPSKIIREKYYLKLSEVNVSNESLISYKSCKYSVPKEFIGKKVGRYIRNNKLHIYYNNKIITVHEITDKKININPAHELIYENFSFKSGVKVNDSDKILQEMENITYDNCK